MVKPLYPGRQLAENAKSIVLTNSLKLQVDLTWGMIDGSAFPTLTTQQAEQVLAGRDMLNNRLKVKLFELGIVGPLNTPTSVRGGIAEVRASKQKEKKRL